MMADAGWSSLPWLSLLALGAVHGINPAMGWLFAVGRGLQERDRRAVWRALGPLALGHAVAVAVAVFLAMALGQMLPNALAAMDRRRGSACRGRRWARPPSPR